MLYVRSYQAGRAGHGLIGFGLIGRGLAWQAWFGSVGCIWVWFDAVRFGRLSKVRSGRAGFGEVRFGEAGTVALGNTRCDGF